MKRGLLLLAIVAVLVATVLLKLKLAERETQTGELGPVARANVALNEANQAAASGDQAGVATALTAAAGALDEALEAAPSERGLMRDRLNVELRRAAVGEKFPQRELAVNYARTLHAQQPSDPRARLDRLKVARILATAHGEHEAAARELAEVEGSLAGTPPGPPVRAALARMWLDLGSVRVGDAAIDALDRGVAHAEADDGDAVESTSRLHAALASAVSRADALRRPAAAERYERRLVEVLELKVKLTPDPVAARRSLAFHLSKLAGRAEDLALHGRAVAERRTVLAAAPSEEARRDLARTLTHLGALHAKHGRDDEAVGAYEEAVKVSEPLTGALRRTRLVALGFLAHLLGRQDRMFRSKAMAAQAYDLAVELLDGGRAAALDAVSAGLRHARLLRARPRPDRRNALRVARAERARLDGLEGARVEELRTALDALIVELR